MRVRVALGPKEPVFECSMPRPHHYRSLIGEEKGSERTFDTCAAGDPVCTRCKVSMNCGTCHVHARVVRACTVSLSSFPGLHTQQATKAG